MTVTLPLYIIVPTGVAGVCGNVRLCALCAHGGGEWHRRSQELPQRHPLCGVAVAEHVLCQGDAKQQYLRRPMHLFHFCRERVIVVEHVLCHSDAKVLVQTVQQFCLCVVGVLGRYMHSPHSAMSQ